MDRSRRKFLLAGTTTTVGLLAGCSGSEEMEGSDHTETTSGGVTTTASGGRSTTTEVTTEPTNTPTMTPMTTTASTQTTTAQASEVAVSIENSKLEKKETSIGTDAYVLGTIVNTGNGTSGELRVKGRFYNKDDNLLDSTTVSLSYLKPGETWVCRIPYLDDGEKVESHKIDGTYKEQPPRFEIDGLSVTNTNLSRGSVSAKVTGTIKNNLQKDADYLGAIARFWKDDTVLAGGLDNITDVPAGENWSFEATYTGYGPRWKEANDYDVIPDVTIY